MVVMTVDQMDIQTAASMVMLTADKRGNWMDASMVVMKDN